ncbi:MerR family DNA-binding transcriptional regulator [Streptomyces himalayensis]|uniref:MerR family DNA-binding transcriptional regulator n=1 Tax=Streptomyces himalayensis subsp. himalayensis TaxID=2756131 RepID=A0A7W0IBQ8_9ACTN|nr:MerR family DNA-binding transcriptional regulator [Streptomyces himalayensis]MBA2949805.1 MerR family DNA-binding transcriptional regulator [Streptomyces himalayensis subsp. himalayensis]
MRIGELARRTAVSERSLRYYEQQGLLSSRRTPGGHREYDESAVDRVIRIQEPLLVAELREQQERLDRMIGELIRAREVLDGVIEAASSEPAPVSPRSGSSG